MRELARAARNFLVYGLAGWFRRPSVAARFWKRIVVASLIFEPPTKVPERRLEEVLPEAASSSIRLEEYCPRYGQPLLEEMLVLCQLVRALDPRTVFEIGTFEGGTTLQIAANSKAEIWTLDLPPDPDRTGCHPETPGWRIHGSPYADRCHQLLGDSRTFSFDDWLGRIDLVFVDANHEYAFVRRDSENALSLVSEQGVIVWHDYVRSHAPGVVRALDELGGNLVHLAGTGLVLRLPSSRSVL